MAATALLILMSFTVLGGRADAASWDNRGGFLRAPDGATAIASVRCGISGADLSIDFGVTPPTYYSWRIVNLNVAPAQWAGGWAPWQPVTSYNAHPGWVITRPGNWAVAISITHWNGYGWYGDEEYALIQNTNALYGANRCHVGR